MDRRNRKTDHLTVDRLNLHIRNFKNPEAFDGLDDSILTDFAQTWNDVGNHFRDALEDLHRASLSFALSTLFWGELSRREGERA